MVLVGDEGDLITSGRVVRLAGKFRGGVLVEGHTIIIDAQGASGEQLDRATLTFSVPRGGPQLHRGEYVTSFRRKAKTDGEFSVSYSTGGCGVATALINIQELQWTNEGISKFAATFERHCGGGSAGVHGCIHVENLKSEARARDGRKSIDVSY